MFFLLLVCFFDFGNASISFEDPLAICGKKMKVETKPPYSMPFVVLRCVLTSNDPSLLIWSTPYGQLIHNFAKRNIDDHEANPIFSSNAFFIGEQSVHAILTFIPLALLNNTEIYCFTPNEVGQKCKIDFEPYKKEGKFHFLIQ